MNVKLVYFSSFLKASYLSEICVSNEDDCHVSHRFSITRFLLCFRCRREKPVDVRRIIFDSRWHLCNTTEEVG